MTNAAFPNLRLRRLRQNPVVRALIQDVNLTVNDFIFPLFIKDGNGIKQPIKSMPGLFQLSLDNLKAEIQEITKLKLPGVMLFGIPATKDEIASQSYAANGIVQQAIKIIKDTAPNLLVMVDVCCCEYTSHGHCGIMNNRNGTIDLDNDATLPILVNQAISFAVAGADMLAPSGMIDGQIGAIRQGLDLENFSHIPLLSHSIKYASSFYGPFREAVEGSPKFGDRKTYQANPANIFEAFREVELDIKEGADIIMVKPAHTYLDIIYKIKQKHPEIPLAAYQVSGEYSMLKAAAQNGWLDEEKVILESLTSIKRAGSNFIITYFGKDVARILEKCS